MYWLCFNSAHFNPNKHCSRLRQRLHRAVSHTSLNPHREWFLSIADWSSQGFAVWLVMKKILIYCGRGGGFRILFLEPNLNLTTNISTFWKTWRANAHSECNWKCCTGLFIFDLFDIDRVLIYCQFPLCLSKSEGPWRLPHTHSNSTFL